MSRRDGILDGIAYAHRELVEAGRAYTAGDRELALQQLKDAQIGLLDAIADLRRLIEDEA